MRHSNPSKEEACFHGQTLHRNCRCGAPVPHNIETVAYANMVQLSNQILQWYCLQAVIFS